MTAARALVVTNDFPPRRGGIESFVLSLCRGLDRDDVVAYTASMPDAAEVDSRLPFRVVRDPNAVLLPTPAVARRVRAAFLRHGCDRVVFGAAAPLGLLAGTLREAGAERVVALTHGHEVWWARAPATRALVCRIARDVDVLSYVSEHCRSGIAPALRAADAGRFVRLSPGVDLDAFTPAGDAAGWRDSWGVGPEQVVVLSASRLVRRKGHDRMIDAWPAVHAAHPTAVLVVAGDGPQRASLERRVRRRGVAASVRFVPGLDWETMPLLYRAADVFALPCRTRRFGLESEAFGIAFVEAAASGLPVVVGRSGGAPETLEDGSTGYLVDPDDVQDIAGRLIGLIADEPLRREIGRRGRAMVGRDFGSAATQARFRDLLFGSADGRLVAAQHEDADDARHHE